jgi:leucyl-tRNA synthetase
MAEYNFRAIEAKWQQFWEENSIYLTKEDTSKPKYYVLDMFPYPSGAGLHVGHPLGYIASDIIARYKRAKGFCVLHPMGFDSFGLPAEQYAIQTGQHPAITTQENIKRYKEQLKNIGFSYDWSREVQTSDPKYYKWTQWIFMRLFEAWYNKTTDKAEHISTLIAEFEKNGNIQVQAACNEDTPIFTAEQWKNFSEQEKSTILLKYRLTYLADAYVNWCPALGTVLANDEVKDGVSERGGYPVERKLMRQWMMRITAYAERLLNDLETLDWSESIKDIQRNWIGKSVGAEVTFYLTPNPLSKGEGAMQKDSPKFHWQTTSPEKWKKLKEFARNNRKNPTKAENILWQALRNRKLDDKFRRQHAIEGFIVDFVCLEKKLVIEIDGNVHLNTEQKEYDEIRTAYLNYLGFTEIRFTNDEVENNLEAVLHKIKELLNSPLLWRGTGGEVKSPLSFGEGAGGEVKSPLSFGEGLGVRSITVFTTRIDTIFGVTYLVLAPENELVAQITTPEQKAEVEAYVEKAINRSERERMTDAKSVSGVFTGAYAINPFTNEQIPVWVSEYVLAGYGTGAVMGVPSSDDRDYRFAKFFNLPIIPVIEGTENLENPTEKKYGRMINSGFLNGLDTNEAIEKAIEFAEANGFGKKKVNYKMRDAVFSRQRYWGEPVPVYFKDGIPYLIDEKDLPLELPKIDKYLPTETGEPPLGRAENWKYTPRSFGEGQGGEVYDYELSTMPGWAGSSWYWLRYMDACNDKEFVSKEKEQYWKNVDLYIGGAEHATGHLLYSRFWNKVLYDLGYISSPEPFQKMINQGMIQGRSNFVYKVLYKEAQAHKRIAEYLLPMGFDANVLPGDMQLDFIHKEKNIAVEIRFQSIIKENWQSYLSKYAEFMPEGCQVLFVSVEEVFTNVEEAVLRVKKALNNEEFLQFPQNDYELPNLFVSYNLREQYETIPLHVDVNLVENDILDIDAFRKWRPDLADAEFILEDGKYICGAEVEKMSKSKYNVVNPDSVIERYGADTLRLYEMFLGPLEQFKPWNTNSIEGVHRFLRKLWRLFYNEKGEFVISEAEPTPKELKILHTAIKRVTEDIERFSFNTPVSSFMICVNELTDLKCNKRAILEPLLVLLSPYVPHISEELWHLLGHKESINFASYPTYEEKYLQEDTFSYPISINGKLRTNIEFALDMPQEDMQKAVLENEIVKKWLDGKPAKKIIIVPKKIVNVVV